MDPVTASSICRSREDSTAHPFERLESARIGTFATGPAFAAVDMTTQKRSASLNFPTLADRTIEPW